MTKKTVATIYNPNLLSKKELIANYVVRVKKFQQIFNEIKSSTMNRPEQHLLIEGQRGMGKTTLLLRLSYEVENDPQLNTWLIPLVFNEEQYEVNSLSGLWELIGKYLAEKNDSFHGLFEEMDSNYARYENDERAYEKFVFELLIRALRRENKKILLFIDNFGEMFNKLESESQRLREILMTCEHLRIIAASSVVSEAFFKYDEPLYEFFKIEKLHELNLEETKSLLINLGETYGNNKAKEIVENEPERIETFRRLTGGVTRTIVLLYEIFVDEESGSAFKDLESILDRVTPLYKHRMDDLSPQLQQIVHVIAMNWDAMPTKEIAEKTRMSSGTVSAQLGKLVKSGMVLKTETNTKNHLYSLNERFFNIWYLMRNGRKGDRNRVIWLARFFENWLSPKELRNRVEKFVENYEESAFEEEQKSYLMLLYRHPILKMPKYLLHDLLTLETKNAKVSTTIEIETLDKQTDLLKYNLINPNFDFSEKEFKDLLFSSGISLKTKGKIIEQFSNLSESAFQKIATSLKKEKEYLRNQAVELLNDEDCDGNLIALANLHKNYLNNAEQAMDFYSKAADIGCFDNYKLGNLYLEEKDSYNAEKYLLRSSQDDENSNALIELGNLYRDVFNSLPEAKDYFKEAYEKTGNSSAIFRYAWVLSKLRQFEDAISAYLEYIKLPGYNGGAFSNIGNIYNFELKNYEIAEKYYLKAIEERNNEDAPRLLAGMYITNMNRQDEGERILMERIKENDIEAMNTLAWNYYLLKIKPEKALEYAAKAFEKDKSIYISHTYATNLLWNNKIEDALKVSKIFFNDPKSFDDFYDDISDFLLLLIAKEAYKEAYELFSSPKNQTLKLKDKFKPLYFALMFYMKEEHPLEFLKMGSELKETVEEVIQKIEEKRLDYD